MSLAELEYSAAQQAYPKFASMSLLRLLGFPTLDATLIAPMFQKKERIRQLHAFAKTNDLSKVLLRIENPGYRFTHRRGGNSYCLSDAEVEIESLVGDGFAVIVMEPTNRFTNQLSMNARLDAPGSITVELLGPGFDVSDLNRGDVEPQATAVWNNVDWTKYESPRWNELTLRIDNSRNEIRIQSRLLKLASYGFVKRTKSNRLNPRSQTATWLEARGYNDLFSSSLSSSHQLAGFLKSKFDDLYLIGSYFFGSHKQTGLSASISASDLGNNRFVYWDVVSPQRLTSNRYRASTSISQSEGK